MMDFALGWMGIDLAGDDGRPYKFGRWPSQIPGWPVPSGEEAAAAEEEQPKENAEKAPPTPPPPPPPKPQETPKKEAGKQSRTAPANPLRDARGVADASAQP